MKAIVLCGGLGTRLGALSGDLPKVMVEVGGVPFLEHVLSYLRESGVSEVILAVGYRKESIVRHFGLSFNGLSIDYSVEDTLLGTGGAVAACFDSFGLQSAIVLNGDTLFRTDLDEIVRSHERCASKLTMAVRPVDDVGRYGHVGIDSRGRVVSFAEKKHGGPGVVNAGIYILERDVFDGYARGTTFSLERDVLGERLHELDPTAVLSGGYFIDIGVPADLMRARRDLSRAVSRRSH